MEGSWRSSCITWGPGRVSAAGFCELQVSPLFPIHIRTCHPERSAGSQLELTPFFCSVTLHSFFYYSSCAFPLVASPSVIEAPWKLVHSACDSDAGLPKHVRHLGVAQTGSVVFEGELVSLLVHAETAQAVCVRKMAQPVELFQAQR
jgi:hypothetical protein